MSKEVKSTQEDPTRPRPTDANGRALDEWGLPLSGPARVAALAEAGKRDPREDPEAWKKPAPPSLPPPPPPGTPKE